MDFQYSCGHSRKGGTGATIHETCPACGKGALLGVRGKVTVHREDLQAMVDAMQAVKPLTGKEQLQHKPTFAYYTCGCVLGTEPGGIVPNRCEQCSKGGQFYRTLDHLQSSEAGQGKPYAWACPKCHDHNQQICDKCLTCGTAKPAAPDGTLKTPTEAQLNDPKWWDENAPADAEVVWLIWNGAPRASNLARVAWAKRGEGVTTVTGQEAGYFHRPEASEPIADRIMELGNQVHNLSCEVQNDEALAGELEDIRGRLWDLGGKVRKAQEREEMVRSAAHVIEMKNGSPITLYLKYCEDLYDAGMLRKAGGQ